MGTSCAIRVLGVVGGLRECGEKLDTPGIGVFGGLYELIRRSSQYFYPTDRQGCLPMVENGIVEAITTPFSNYFPGKSL